MFKLSSTSIGRLQGVHPLLVKCVNRALELSEVDFSVIEGVRTVERQKELMAAGKSWTMNSYHIARDVPSVGNVGLAVDLYPFVNGSTSMVPDQFKKVAKAMYRASQELGIRVEWGGLWESKTLDMPHYQLIV